MHLRFLTSMAIMAVLLAPHAAADATGDVARLEGDLGQASDEFAGMSLLGEGGAGIRDLDVSVAGGHAVVWRQISVASGTMPTCAVIDQTCFSLLQTVPGTEESQRFPDDGGWAAGQLSLMETTDAHQMNIFPLGTSTISVEAPTMRLEAMDEACLDQHGITEANTCDGFDPEYGFMSAVPMPEPVQVVDGDGHIVITLQGDLVLEFLNMVLEAPDGTVIDAVSGETTGPSAHEARFARVLLANATLRMTVESASRAVWATGAATSDVVGTALVSGMAGSLGLDEVQRLDGQVEARGAFLLHSTPSDDGLVLSGEGQSLDARPHAAATQMPVGWAWWLAAAAALLPAVAIYLMVGRRGNVTMDRVEAALQAGRYDRAARLADRLLTFEPYDESAHLGRAIALTKAGRLADAATALHTYLSHNEPEDGSLHYVLGTALKELGEHERAHDAMAEAAKRTPELAQPLGDDRAAYA